LPYFYRLRDIGRKSNFRVSMTQQYINEDR